jgi:orotate phosphoribosyltransferase-like protein
MSPPRQPESAFLRHLRRALVEDVRAEIDLALRVAELRSPGLTRAQVAERLDVSEDALRSAYGLLDRTAAHRR